MSVFSPAVHIASNQINRRILYIRYAVSVRLSVTVNHGGGGEGAKRRRPARYELARTAGWASFKPGYSRYNYVMYTCLLYTSDAADE